jgi:hypothetical protein
VNLNGKIGFYFFARLCCSCSRVKVIAILISGDLNLQFVLISRDLSRALLVYGRSPVLVLRLFSRMEIFITASFFIFCATFSAG